MARKLKADTAASDDRLRLIEALKFAAIASKSEDGKYAYVQIRDKMLTASNDTFSMGVPVEIALDLCPQAEQLLAALVQCGQSFQLTQVELHSVSIKSDRFRALVPVVDVDILEPVEPDVSCAEIDDRIRDAMTACLRVFARGDRIMDMGALLTAHVMACTSGMVLLEYWHGINLPPDIIVPKKTMETVVKISKPLKGFGFSDTSVTFWFDDGSFVKSRRVSGEYPKYEQLFTKYGQPDFKPIWPEFYAAIGAVEKFLEPQSDTFYWNADNISSHHTPELGATYRVEGVPPGHAFNPVYWKQIEPYVTHIGFTADTHKDPIAWHGAVARGLIMGKARK